jgi:hypothetical protein
VFVGWNLAVIAHTAAKLISIITGLEEGGEKNGRYLLTVNKNGGRDMMSAGV